MPTQHDLPPAPGQPSDPAAAPTQPSNPAPAVTAADLAAVRAALSHASPHATAALLACAAAKLEDRFADALATASRSTIRLSGLRTKLAAVRAVAADAAVDASALVDSGSKQHPFFMSQLLKRLAKPSESHHWPLTLGEVLSMKWPTDVPPAARAAWLKASPHVWVVGDRVMRAGDAANLNFVGADAISAIGSVDDAAATAVVAASADLTAVLAARVTALETEAASLRARALEAELGAAAAWKIVEEVQATAEKTAAKLQAEAGAFREGMKKK